MQNAGHPGYFLAAWLLPESEVWRIQRIRGKTVIQLASTFSLACGNP